MAQVIVNNKQKIDTLKKRSDFLRVARADKSWVTPGFIVQACLKDETAPMVGYTASKKVGNAVQRSRAKRRMREIAKQVLTKNGQGKHDYVLIARKAILDLPFKDLIRDLKWSLKSLHDNNHKDGEREN